MNKQGHSQELVVLDEVEITSQIDADVRVKAGGRLLVGGPLLGDLYVEGGGIAVINDKVRGCVVNLGGNVTLTASASCLAVVDEGQISSTIDTNAEVTFGRVRCERGGAATSIAVILPKKRSRRGRA